jgi:hypothetical protein
MGGRSGRATAAHTPLIRYGDARFAVSTAQLELVRASLERGGIYVKGARVRSAALLVRLGVATLTDDGAFGPKAGASNIDGERWTFKVVEGVEVEP